MHVDSPFEMKHASRTIRPESSIVAVQSNSVCVFHICKFPLAVREQCVTLSFEFCCGHDDGEKVRRNLAKIALYSIVRLAVAFTVLWHKAIIVKGSWAFVKTFVQQG